MTTENETLSFNRITSENEIYDLLVLFSSTLSSLRKGENRTHQIAQKLSKYANVFTLNTGNEIVGFVAFYANDHDIKVAYISFIAVLSSYRGKGYGSIILKNVENESRRCGMLFLKLEVHKNNAIAQKLYQKNGMIYDGDASSESIYMIKKIIEVDNE